MQNDPVVNEVRQIRHAYAERFGFDLRAMVADLRRKEQNHPEICVHPDQTSRGFGGIQHRSSYATVDCRVHRWCNRCGTHGEIGK